MKLYYEWGVRQINKRGEELCGDSIVISRHPDSIALAVSDGLGSGVKASILATLTTQIAMHLLENHLPLDEVVETLTSTLPVDRVRKLAYSTFILAEFLRAGTARVMEFDAPSTILLRRRKVVPLAYTERSIADKLIKEAVVDLELGDWIAFVSDGVLNAGIGGVYPLGWGWDQAARFLEKHAHPDLNAEDLADKVADTVRELYAGPPGDDVTIVIIKARRKLTATVFTGPPRKKNYDKETVDRFINYPGKHVVCGGTTAKIVSRHLAHPLEVDLKTMTDEVPPQASIEGIDLVCEGILTLTRTNTLLQTGTDRATVRYRVDGASNLLRLMLGVDHVHFVVGQAVNPAHQNPELPNQLGIRLKVVEEIAEALRGRGKEATIEKV
jgi:hypothetical protein